MLGKGRIDLRARLRPATRPVSPGLALPPPALPVASPYRVPARVGRDEEPRGLVRRRSWLLAVGLAIGCPLGYALDSLEHTVALRNERLQTSEELLEYVRACSRSIGELDSALQSTHAQLSKNEFPVDEVPRLARIDLTLDGTHLGLLNLTVLGSKTWMLFSDFTRLASLATSSTLRLVTLLTGPAAEMLPLLFKETRQPRVVWGAELVQTPQGVWGRVRPLDLPFWVDGSWPARLRLIGNARADDRFGTSASEKPEVLPIDPSTLDRPSAKRLLINVLVEIERLRRLIHGGPRGELGLSSTARALLRCFGSHD